MGELGRRTIDVRDMLCAQALALVAQAAGRLADGEPIDILYSADDVRRDLVAWARERAYELRELCPGTIRLQPR